MYEVQIIKNTVSAPVGIWFRSVKIPPPKTVFMDFRIVTERVLNEDHTPAMLGNCESGNANTKWCLFLNIVNRIKHLGGLV